MDLQIDLQALLPKGRVTTRAIDRIAHAADASVYRLIPQAVVEPDSIEEIQALFRYSHEHGIPLTFRAGGTSLSGQAISDGILVDVTRRWRKFQVENGGHQVRLGPGLVGGQVNLRLKAHHRRIGPDPASIDAAQIGGIVANNASGMCCGVSENSYHTLHSMRFLLPNGLVLDTDDPQAGQKLAQTAPEIDAGLRELRKQILADSRLSGMIREKYRMKNTTGYTLNALLDYEEPLDILGHLMVGSEGTLGFIAEVVLNTLPAYPFKLTSMLYFASVQAASDAIRLLAQSGARAIEIIDRAGLQSVAHLPGAPTVLSILPDGAAALLVEYQCETEAELSILQGAAATVCASLPLLQPARFTTDPAEQAALWKIRKGMYPSIGAMRQQGTTVLIEDVAFPLPVLADAITDLQHLFRVHGYPEAIIFGHAKDGNIHFVLTPSFNTPAEVQQYSDFMQAVVDLVTRKYGGALKAEHGTGRNIAPFVEAEWGAEAAGVMRGLKALLDPTGLLNPGVIINDHPHAHVEHLKPLPVVEAEVDKCIECGFCEPTCPSRDLTLTPRRRIVVRREMARLQASGENPRLLAELQSDYVYAGLETCAVDGLCAVACPVEINTGMLVKRLRAERISPRGQAAAQRLARNFKTVERGLRLGVGAAHLAEKIIGWRGVRAVTVAAEKVSGITMPKWSGVVPQAVWRWRPETSSPDGADQVVYFPSCIARVMGSAPDTRLTLPQAFALVGQRAGLGVNIPEQSEGNCCGMPFSSKGYTAAFRATLHQTLGRFWEWSEEGRLPVVIDSSSCAYTLRTCASYLSPEDRLRWQKMRILDPVEFMHDIALPRLTLKKLPVSVALHPNCSARKLKLDGKMETVARACADRVFIPLELGCCGYAGDRGLLFPELTRSASHHESVEVLREDYDGYYSSNLTCEMGMREATGKPYRSLIYLLEEASRQV